MSYSRVKDRLLPSKISSFRFAFFFNKLQWLVMRKYLISRRALNSYESASLREKHRILLCELHE